MNLEGGKGQGKAKGKGTKGNAKGRAKGNAMGKAKAKGKKATKEKAKAKAQSKGKGKGLQDEYDGGDESDSHPNEDNIPDGEDFRRHGQRKGHKQMNSQRTKGKGNAKDMPKVEAK